MKFGALLLLSAVSLSAQPAMEITGKVVDPSTNLGIYDATVIVSRMEPREGTTDAHIETARLTTDAQGSFRFSPTVAASYQLVAEKKGFRTVALGAARGLSSQTKVAVSAETPRRSVQLALGQNGTITGRVLDLETGEPVANVTVQIGAYISEYGVPFLSLGGMTRTDAKGAYTVDVPSGRYLVWAFPQLGVTRLAKSFTDADAAETDRSYAGTDLSTVFPITLPSGGRVDAGTLRIKQEQQFRARVRTGGACSPDQSVSLDDMVLTPRGTSTAVLGNIPCGSEVLIRGLQPGQHTLTGTIGKTPAEMLTGVVQFEIRDANQNLELTLARGPDISGRVVASEGADKIPLDRVRFRLMTRPTTNEQRTGEPGPEGGFRLENLRFGRKQIVVDGLGEQFYVKQVRFNGAPAPDGILDITGNASIEVEIDSHPATLTGTAEQQGKTVPGAEIVLTPWGSNDIDRIRHYRADDNGVYRIPAIVPGEYRIFAVAPAKWESANEAGVWQGLMAAAEKVVLSRGAAQTLTLKLSEPR